MSFAVSSSYSVLVTEFSVGIHQNIQRYGRVGLQGMLTRLLHSLLCSGQQRYLLNGVLSDAIALRFPALYGQGI